MTATAHLASMPDTRTQRYTEQTLDLDAIAADEYIVIAEKPSEQRAQLTLWDEIRANKERNVIVLASIDRDTVAVSINACTESQMSLLDERALQNLLSNKNILLDISGFSHSVWAPLLKAAHKAATRTRVLYAEPVSYKFHPNPSSQFEFDLSKEFEGLAPLPGFAQLSEPEHDDRCVFIAMLGFEGSRPRTLMYELDPAPKVIPIVGIPGFQIEFPSYTITCNKELLGEYQAYSDIRYAKANCPFEAFEVLKAIEADHPNHYMYIAPVGTKPHSLGSILFAITHPENTEILFDNPVRKDGRTKGVGMISIYDFEHFNDYKA